MSTRLQNKDKDERALTVIKRAIAPNDITNLRAYARNNSTSKYMKRKLIKLKGEIDNYLNTGGDITTLSQQ